jgi:hypothetical protein
MDDLAEALRKVTQALERPQLQPDPEAGSQRAELDEAVGTYRAVVLPQLKETLQQLDSYEQRRVVQGVAQIAERLGAALLSASAEDVARALMSETLAQLPPGAHADELAAASRDAEAYRLLTHARWLLAQGRRSPGLAAADAAARRTTEPLLRTEAQKLVDPPEPLRSAPSLITFNGFGTRLYGRDDVRADGFYTSTVYLCALFIPLLPLGRYVVRAADGGGWHFAAQRPLTRTQRWYRRLLALAVVAVLGGNAVNGYLHSPKRLAARDVAAAHATQSWDEVLERWQGEDVGEVLAPAVEVWTAQRVKQVKRPFEPAQLDEVKRLAARVLAFAPASRGTAMATLDTALRAWAADLGTSERQKLEVALELLKLAEPDGETRTQTVKLRKTLAQKLEAEWPLRAVEQYTLSAEPEALARAGELMGGLTDVGTLLVEESEVVEAWLAAAKNDPHAEKIKEQLGAARALTADAGRKERLDSHDRGQLAEDQRRFPGDQSLTVALAAAARAEGDANAALVMLEARGPLGRMIGDAQRLKAFVLIDLHRNDEAEKVLTAYLDGHLQRFVDTRAELDKTTDTTMKALVERAKLGRLPPDLDARLANQSEEKQRDLFFQWAQHEVERDPTLQKLRERYQALSGVVDASIALGTLELERAATQSGAERQRLLAEAERVFLAVSAEAEGTPAYHLGLGQVLHRLGKAEEGDRELKTLAERGDARTKLEVSVAYRSLGLIAQARALAEQLYQTGQQPEADQAASELSAMAITLEDSELWLSRLKSPSATQQARIDEVRGVRLLREGQYPEAERELIKATDAFERSAGIDGSSANNAAVTWVERYQATGDPAALDHAVNWYAKAVALASDEPMVLSNMISVLLDRTSLAMLEKHLPLKQLKLQTREAQSVLFTLLDGPLKADLTRAIRATPTFSRALELMHKLQALAPNDPEAYDDERNWLAHLDDVQGLERLRERLQRVEKLDRTLDDERAANRSDAARRETDAKSARARLHVLRTLELPASGAPLGAVSAVKCDWHLRLANLVRDLSEAEQAAQQCADAFAAWPALAEVDPTLAALQGVLEVAQKVPRLSQKLAGDPRDALFLAWQLARKDGAVAAALAANSTVQKAAALVARLAPTKWTRTSWLIADLANDAALREKVAAQPLSQVTALSKELLELLAPKNPWVAQDHTLREAMQVNAAR